MCVNAISKYQLRRCKRQPNLQIVMHKFVTYYAIFVLISACQFLYYWCTKQLSWDLFVNEKKKNHCPLVFGASVAFIANVSAAVIVTNHFRRSTLIFFVFQFVYWILQWIYIPLLKELKKAKDAASFASATAKLKGLFGASALMQIMATGFLIYFSASFDTVANRRAALVFQAIVTLWVFGVDFCCYSLECQQYWGKRGCSIFERCGCSIPKFTGQVQTFENNLGKSESVEEA